MKKRITLLVFTFPLLFFLSPEDLFAQYRISSAVFSGGGGHTVGANYSVSATVGQPAIGTVSGVTNQARTGFWYLAGAVVFTSVEESNSEIPAELRLEHNYPNPFNPSTTINFALPADIDVRLVVYNMLGREVATLIDEKKAAGTYKVNFDAGNLASGVYLYQLEAGNQLKTHKMTLVK